MDIMNSSLPFPETESFAVGSNSLYLHGVSRSVCNAAESSLAMASSCSESTLSISYSNSHSVSTVAEAVSKSSSPLRWMFSTSTSTIFQLKRTQWIPKRRSGCKHSNSKSLKSRKPVLLRKIPFCKSSKYLTVYVGARIEQSVKFVISRGLLVHPLFQVLLKCSEDEFGEDYAVENGVAVVCVVLTDCEDGR